MNYFPSNEAIINALRLINRREFQYLDPKKTPRLKALPEKSLRIRPKKRNKR